MGLRKGGGVRELGAVGEREIAVYFITLWDHMSSVALWPVYC